MKATVFKCDVCKREKLETNHWFWLIEVEMSNPTQIVIGWFDDIRDDDKHEHICSQKCLSERINKWANAPTAALSTATLSTAQLSEES